MTVYQYPSEYRDVGRIQRNGVPILLRVQKCAAEYEMLILFYSSGYPLRDLVSLRLLLVTRAPCMFLYLSFHSNEKQLQ